jgi:MarR family transcriptional regulator for hemolysin
MQSYDQTLMNLTVSLTHVARAYRAALDKVAADYGLSQATAWPVLWIGRMGDGVRPGVLADAVGLEPSSLVRIIDHLIETGLVERHDDAQDRRAKTLHLTEVGKERAGQIEKALVPFRRKLFDGVDEADIVACLRVLDSLNSAIVKSSDNNTGRKAA